jgi:phosphopantetheine--protein transferase-like protein
MPLRLARGEQIVTVMEGAHISIRSCLETVLIQEVKRSREAILCTHFTDDERAAFDQLPVQSIAGQLAVKRAVCRLAAALKSALALSCRQVVVLRDQSGAPKIGSISCADEDFRALLEAEVLVSISHSKTTAIGLAVIAEPIDGPGWTGTLL